MLASIVQSAVKNKVVVLLGVILLIAAGIMALRGLPINSLPDVTPIQVLVITKAGMYAPNDVEKLVSFPIENAMNGLPKVKQLRSVSQFGLSVVMVEFNEGTDIYFARQVVEERLRSVAGNLPPGVDPPALGPVSTALGEIYQYEVYGPGYSLTELREIHDWMIIPQLKTIRGVTEITAFGGFVKQFDVLPNPDKMRFYKVSWEKLASALQENSGVAGGNFMERNGEQFIVRADAQFRSIEDLQHVLVSYNGENPVFVKDIAQVSLGQQIRQGAVTRDGKGEVVTGVIMMLRDENSKEVIERIHTKIEELNKQLPTGITLASFYDQSELVGRTTSTLTTNLLEGGAFVIVVLLLLLGEIKGAIIVAAVIPFSMLCAFIGMNEVGLAANLMSLGAIDFGMIVDGSVVMMEQIVSRLQRKKAGENTQDIIVKAGSSVARPIFFGVLIILLVYVPIATFEGMEGILFRPMALTVSFALIGSLILALTFVPALASVLFKKGVRQRKTIVSYIEKPYKILLTYVFIWKKTAFVAAFGGLALTLSLMTTMGTEFLPELEEGSILVEVIQLPSVTLEHSVATADKLAQKIKNSIPEVRTVVPKTGRSDLANDWMGVHQTDMFIPLKDTKLWRKGITKDSIESLVAKIVQEEHGIAFNITQPIAMRVDELTSGVKSDIAVKIFGDNLDTLSEIGHKIVALAEKLPGTANVYTEQTIGQPYLTIVPSVERAARYGISVGEVLNAVSAGIGGLPVSQVFQGQRRFDVVIRLPYEYRNNQQKMEELPIMLPSGEMLPLAAVADISIAEGPREITRENSLRRTVVSINIGDIALGDYVASLKSELERANLVPAGYFLQYGGTFENQERATAHLMLVVPAVIVIILTLLFIMFGTLRHTLLVCLNLPFALSGGIVLLWLRDMNLSITASIGFIALFGVAVLNGIVLIERLNELRHEGWSLRNTLLLGTTDRLRPVLMTAFVAGLGFLPMAFNTGPGSEVQRPLATVVIGGLVSSTLLTLVILPLLYHTIERLVIIRAKRKK